MGGTTYVSVKARLYLLSKRDRTERMYHLLYVASQLNAEWRVEMEWQTLTLANDTRS